MLEVPIKVLSFAGASWHKSEMLFEHRFWKGTDGDPNMADS